MVTLVEKRSYYTAPGLSDLASLQPETLEKAIMRVFKTDIFEKSRKQKVIYAKHFYRYVIERLTKDNRVTSEKRTKYNTKLFKYSLYNIALICDCDHVSIIHSSKTASNLIQTDRNYKRRCEEVLTKIEHNLIFLP